LLANRDKIFISHATPSDNNFAIWLSARLSMSGYDVWCDTSKLLGGEDFWQEIEKTLRDEAAKFLIVISGNAYSDANVLRDGIRKELALAEVVKKKLDDPYFIVPIRLDGTSYGDFAVELIRINGVDCSSNWAAGFSQILELFERDSVPKINSGSPSLKNWRDIHMRHTSAISEQSEVLQSNWLPITQMPETLYFFERPGARWSAEPRVIASQSKLPTFAHGQLLAGFAPHNEMQEAVGEEFPIKDRGTLPLKQYLRGNTGDILGIAPRDAQNQVSSLIRQAWDVRMEQLGLNPYPLANGQLAWWFPLDLPENGKLLFTDFNGKLRKRAATGIKGQKELPSGKTVPRNHWHLGFTAQPMLGEENILKLRSRIVISEDGRTPIADKTRLNGLRRSLTKMWFNEKWRGLTLGFANFVADGSDEISLPSSKLNSIVISAQPLSFQLDRGIASDPVDENLSDELADAYDQEEESLRLNDPVFSSLINHEEHDDE